MNRNKIGLLGYLSNIENINVNIIVKELKLSLAIISYCLNIFIKEELIDNNYFVTSRGKRELWNYIK